MPKTQTINVKVTDVNIIRHNNEDYISLTDMIKNFGDDTIVKNWLRNRNTVEFLGIWEQINNPNFNSVEFDLIRNQTGLNSFVLSAKKWMNTTNAIDIIANAVRYGDSFA